jgi:flagellar basal-body rod protein FlgF
MNAIEIAALGLRHDNERLKVTAHNLANLNTPAYKRQVMVQQPFLSVMEAMAQSTASTATVQDLRAGKLTSTSRPLDVALPDGRYLVVAAEDGALALTRQGALALDAQGQLQLASGGKVQGLRGDIQLPRDAQAVSVDASGRVLADGRVVDELRVVGLKPGTVVTPLGAGVLQADSGNWQTDGVTTGIRSGHLEASNVVSSQEMVQLMGATRHAESMVRVMQAADEMLEKAIRKLGDMA